MPKLCFYFHLHQPFRIKDINVFDISLSERIFSTTETDNQNQRIFHKVAEKSYYPMLNLLKMLLYEIPHFKFSLSISGVFLEQAKHYDTGIITLLQEIMKTGRVEILAETYYHSLASLYSDSEFEYQVRQHTRTLRELFGYTPSVFRNTELVYSNDIGYKVAKLGFQGMLTEAVPRFLGDRLKTQLFRSYTDIPIPLMLKHAELSDDIAFRFSNRNWESYPLHADTFLDWLHIYPEHEYVNLFMDFETFGEHQWAAEGIFEFFAELVRQFSRYDWNQFVTPKEVFSHYLQSSYQLPQDIVEKPSRRSSKGTKVKKKRNVGADNTSEVERPQHLWDLPVYDVPQPISWADIDRDLTAWVDNDLQKDAIAATYSLEKEVLQSGNQDLIHYWRNLQTSDHFYFMCTKWASDGDVHAYFSPYESPYEAYRRFSIALADLQDRLMTVSTNTRRVL